MSWLDKIIVACASLLFLAFLIKKPLIPERAKPLTEAEKELIYFIESHKMMLEYIDREGICKIIIGKDEGGTVNNCNLDYIDITDERTGINLSMEGWIKKEAERLNQYRLEGRK